jgi:uncharacterized protein (DUF2164 family)
MHELGEFKGNKTIKLMRNELDKYPFNFGLNKAKLILDNLDAVRKFVEDNEKRVEKPLTEVVVETEEIEMEY